MKLCNIGDIPENLELPTTCGLGDIIEFIKYWNSDYIGSSVYPDNYIVIIDSTVLDKSFVMHSTVSPLGLVTSTSQLSSTVLYYYA